jgi:hypothetical protein
VNETPRTADILVSIAHPHGELELPLAEWMRVGPGPRELVRPIAARSAATGQPLPLSVVPLAYRNDRLSRTLIRLGLLKNPWP